VDNERKAFAGLDSLKRMRGHGRGWELLNPVGLYLGKLCIANHRCALDMIGEKTPMLSLLVIEATGRVALIIVSRTTWNSPWIAIWFYFCGGLYFPKHELSKTHSTDKLPLILLIFVGTSPTG